MKQNPSDAVLKARELILSALENADSTALELLISLQEMIRNLNFVRLLEEVRKREVSEPR
jgi:ABC-type transporter Mla MlaB component